MFPDRLKTLRKSKGVTQSDVATALQLECRTYGSWERAEREPDFARLCQLADYFGVTTDYLLGREPPEIVAIEKLPEETPPGYVRGKVEIPADGMAIDALRDIIRQVIREELGKIVREWQE